MKVDFTFWRTPTSATSRIRRSRKSEYTFRRLHIYVYIVCNIYIYTWYQLRMKKSLYIKLIGESIYKLFRAEHYSSDTVGRMMLRIFKSGKLRIFFGVGLRIFHLDFFTYSHICDGWHLMLCVIFYCYQEFPSW